MTVPILLFFAGIGLLSFTSEALYPPDLQVVSFRHFARISASPSTESLIQPIVLSVNQKWESIIKQVNPLQNFAYASSSPLSGEVKESANDFNIAIAGDWGCTDDARKTASSIEDKDPELVLMPGDLSYESSPKCWYDIISPFASKTKIAIGNHDDEEDQIKKQYMEIFNLTESFYSFDYKNVHVLVMDTELPFAEGSSQYNFVKEDLLAASLNATTDWIFVMFHKPMYASPASHVAGNELRSTYHPLFETYGIDLVIQAHNHVYERTFPIGFNEDDISKPIINRTNNNYGNSSFFARSSDPIFVVVGTGGRSLYDIKDSLPYAAYTSAQDFGFLNIDIINDGNVLAGKFYANSENAIDSDDAIKDQFAKKSKDFLPPIQLQQNTSDGATLDIQKAKQFIKNQ
jgi:Calcineurin-like phosphoesterase